MPSRSPAPPVVNYTLTMPHPDYERIHALAVATRTTIAAQLRQAITDYLDRQDAPRT